MEYNSQLQRNECSRSMTDAKDFLDYIAANPPEPFSGGCARTALRTFLRSLQFGAIYHEHGRYRKQNNNFDASERSTHATGHEPHVSVIVVTHDKVPTEGHSQIPQRKPHNMLFSDQENVTTVSASNNSRHHNGFTDLKRRSRAPAESGQNISGAETTLADAFNNTESYNDAYVKQNLSATSLEPRGNCLSRIAESQNQTARELIASLGYDMCQTENGKAKNKKEEKAGHSKSSWLKSLWSDRTYALIILVIVWAYSLRCIMYFFLDYEILLMTKLIPLFWTLLVAGVYTTTFVSSVKSDHFYSFFARWAAIFQDPETLSLGIRGNLCIRFITVVLVLQWIMVVINTACCVFIMAMEDKFSAGMNIVIYVTGQRSIPIIVLSGIIMFYCSTAWVGSCAFIAVLCHLICSHFWEFGQVLKLHIIAASDGFPQLLKRLREHHLAMCETVSVLDRFVSIYTAVFYGMNITVTCFILYQLVNVPMDDSVKVIAVMWLAAGILFMGVITYYLSNVNLAMHSAGDELYTIQTNNLTVEQLAQLQMFLAKVNGGSMGFTVLGMVVVTRELMMTLFGLLITYGIVLLQFQ